MRFRTLAGVSLALVSSGCSLMVLRDPTPVPDPRRDTIQCEDPYVPVVLDFLMGAAALSVAARVANDACKPQTGDVAGVGASVCESTQGPAVLILGSAAAFYLASAGTGVYRGVRCAHARSLQSRCQDGDGEACLELSPGTVPAPPSSRHR